MAWVSSPWTSTNTAASRQPGGRSGVAWLCVASAWLVHPPSVGETVLSPMTGHALYYLCVYIYISIYIIYLYPFVAKLGAVDYCFTNISSRNHGINPGLVLAINIYRIIIIQVPPQNPETGCNAHISTGNL